MLSVDIGIPDDVTDSDCQPAGVELTRSKPELATTILTIKSVDDGTLIHTDNQNDQQELRSPPELVTEVPQFQAELLGCSHTSDT